MWVFSLHLEKSNTGIVNLLKTNSIVGQVILQAFRMLLQKGWSAAILPSCSLPVNKSISGDVFDINLSLCNRKQLKFFRCTDLSAHFQDSSHLCCVSVVQREVALSRVVALSAVHTPG